MNLDAQYQDEFSIQEDFADTDAYCGKVYDINQVAHNIAREKISNSFEEFEEIQIAISNSEKRSAFTTIYNKLYPYSFFFARKFVSPEDAADVVASVFLKFWLIPDKHFTNLSHIKAFLRICVRNACLTHL